MRRAISTRPIASHVLSVTRILNTRFLNQMQSVDVARNLCQAMARGLLRALGIAAPARDASMSERTLAKAAAAARVAARLASASEQGGSDQGDGWSLAELADKRVASSSEKMAARQASIPMRMASREASTSETTVARRASTLDKLAAREASMRRISERSELEASAEYSAESAARESSMTMKTVARG